MKVTVHLYGRFKEAAGQSTLTRDIPEGTTVSGLYDLLGIKERVYRMALVNGFRVKDDKVLMEGDDLHVFQPVGGG